MLGSNHNLNSNLNLHANENTQTERRSPSPYMLLENAATANFNHNSINNNNVNLSLNNPIIPTNARDNSLHDMSNLYFNVFSEHNNYNSNNNNNNNLFMNNNYQNALNNFEINTDPQLLSGRNFDMDMDEIYQNMSFLINNERYLLYISASVLLILYLHYY